MATPSGPASETRPLLADDVLPASYTRSNSPTTDEEPGSTTWLSPSRSPDAYVRQEYSPLGRTVSWTSAYIIIISRVIGSGIFATPGTILRAVGSPGLALCLWILGALIAGCGMVVSLEYGCMLPRSGGSKVYLEFTYRYPRFLASTMVAAHILLLGFSASNCVVFSRYVLFALGIDAHASDVLRKGVAVGLLSAITVVHGCFPRLGIRIQNWLGYVKVGIVAFMVLSGLYVVTLSPASSGIQSGRPPPSWEGLWEGSVWNLGTIAVAFFQVSYSYAGLDNVNNILNEVKDPVRTLPSVASTALLTAGILYTLTNIAYFMVVPVQEIKDSGEMIAALFFERLFGQHLGRIALPLAIALSAAGNVMVVVIAQVGLPRRFAFVGPATYTALVPPQTGNSPPGPSPFPAYPLLHAALWLPPRRPPSPLRPVLLGDCLPAVCGGVLFYPLRGGLPRAIRLLRRWRGSHMAPIQEAGPQQAVQGVDASGGLGAVSERVADSVTVLCRRRAPDVCGGGYSYVSIYHGASTPRIRTDSWDRILSGVAYWAVWAVLLPKIGGYKLEENGDVLPDGTTITRLVHVHGK